MLLTSSHWRCSIKKAVLKKPRNVNTKTPVLKTVFFNKVRGLKACNFIKKRLQHNCFPVNVTKIFKNTYFGEHLRMAASVYST